MAEKGKKPAKASKKHQSYAGKRHYFFLNPYQDCAFTRCPKCNNKTRQRKFPLVINIEPMQPFILNKICRYCPYCDLIIARKSEVESLMRTALEKTIPEIIGNEYLVFGTLEKADWRRISKTEVPPHELIKRTYVFKDVWNFEVVPAGWYPKEKE